MDKELLARTAPEDRLQVFGVAPCEEYRDDKNNSMVNQITYFKLPCSL